MKNVLLIQDSLKITFNSVIKLSLLWKINFQWKKYK